ncbi:uncharacterized protein BX664DRAFT_343004 [Halteromyces radiatus]|uniref:uncharacterized protein n=1 Tax=Halteromyces radiatus TaxID=101107 RepID=UPI00221EE05C|nr:uncharacterized protein BX664DRAFT_343004 [Halteromyces radiatus]KAI8078894.1 hypothetical protein BX664DRAFT_343004 [Halteromyces radiatus]
MTETTLKSIKSVKRFSLANLTKSFQNNHISSPPSSPEERNNRRRPDRTQSLFIKPPSPPLSPSKAPRPSFQDELPKKSHTQHIKKTIRRSLSVIMYANPSSKHQEEQKSHLVPVLVTPNVEDPMILMTDKPTTTTTTTEKIKNKRILEYDNNIIIEPIQRKKEEEEKNEEKDDLLILWQGYGYTLNTSTTQSLPCLETFDKERWTSYQGLIHPLHLFMDLDEQLCWQALSVAELRRYYDNYGSMMLKQREWRQQQQTLQYHPTSSISTTA